MKKGGIETHTRHRERRHKLVLSWGGAFDVETGSFVNSTQLKAGRMSAATVAHLGDERMPVVGDF